MQVYMYVQRCSRCLKPAVWLMLLGHYPQHKSQTALTLAYCCLHFPIFAVALTDAQVVSRRDTSPDISRCCSVITTGLAYT